MYCPQCGFKNAETSKRCRTCGISLEDNSKALPSCCGAFNIPRNACALWAYYLGIGSLICGIAGIPAFITGILGVRYAKRNPQAKGAIHAWVGIILGGITTLLQLAVIVIIAAAAISAY